MQICGSMHLVCVSLLPSMHPSYWGVTRNSTWAACSPLVLRHNAGRCASPRSHALQVALIGTVRDDCRYAFPEVVNDTRSWTEPVAEPGSEEAGGAARWRESWLLILRG